MSVWGQWTDNWVCLKLCWLFLGRWLNLFISQLFSGIIIEMVLCIDETLLNIFTVFQTNSLIKEIIFWPVTWASFEVFIERSEIRVTLKTWFVVVGEMSRIVDVVGFGEEERPCVIQFIKHSRHVELASPWLQSLPHINDLSCYCTVVARIAL